MSNFIGRPPFSNSLWVGIETMLFHIAQTKIFLRTPSFPIQGVPMNNLAPMNNCPGGGGVQGNLNWMPGYKDLAKEIERIAFSSNKVVKASDEKKGKDFSDKYRPNDRGRHTDRH